MPRISPTHILIVIASTLLCAATEVRAQQNRDGIFEVRYSQAGSVNGFVRVREFQVFGDKLDLEDDLGLREWEAVDLVWSFSPPEKSGFRLEVTMNRLTGSAVLPQDIVFNNTRYQAGGTVTIDDTEYFRLSTFYQMSLSGIGGPSNSFFLIGLVADFIDFHIDGPLSPQSNGTEKRENFATQGIPFPVIGFGGVLPFGRSGLFVWEMYGLSLKSLNTRRSEGGKVEVDQSVFSGVLGLRWPNNVILSSLSLRYRRLKFNQQSSEDGNEFEIQGTSLEIGLLQGRF